MSLPNTTSGEQSSQRMLNTSGDGAVALLWPIAPKITRLEAGHVHLWAADMSEFVEQVSKLSGLLSSAEHERAEKFKFEADSNRYVIRRGLQRLILGRYLEQAPSMIEFQHGAYGKPEVRTERAGSPLFFNASHSAGIAVWAITSACRVGVDVEKVREIPEMEEIARRFFVPAETRTLMALHADSRVQAFYSCWTRKEAYLKALRRLQEHGLGGESMANGHRRGP
jgi:4'-phosphopantetheinyl transferase